MRHQAALYYGQHSLGDLEAAKLRPNCGQTPKFADMRVRPTDTNAHFADTEVRSADTSHAISCAHPQYLIATSKAELVYQQGPS